METIYKRTNDGKVWLKKVINKSKNVKYYINAYRTENKTDGKYREISREEFLKLSK